MLELTATSALMAVAPFKGNDLAITERNEFSLIQISGFGKPFEKSLALAVGKLPAKIGQAAVNGARTVLRLAPQQFWVVGPVADAFDRDLPEECQVTSLSSSRFRIHIEGQRTRQLLAHCAQVDFHASAFKPGNFAMTGIHHTPVLIHCSADNSFDIYVLRTFALNLWEVLVDAAA